MILDIDVKDINKAADYIKVTHYVLIDYIEKVNYKDVLNDNRAKYIFYELIDEFKEIYSLLDKRKTLMATSLLRNAYEELMYIIAISENSSLDANVNTRPGHFISYVSKNSKNIFGETPTSKDINKIYGYLSKLVHVTNLKEVASYVASEKNTSKIIAREMKCSLIFIEFLYLYFLSRKLNIDIELPTVLSTYMPFFEFINIKLLVKESERKKEVLMSYIRNEENHKYLKGEAKKVANELNKVSVDQKEQLMNNCPKIIELIKKHGYEEFVESVIKNKNNY